MLSKELYLVWGMDPFCLSCQHQGFGVCVLVTLGVLKQLLQVGGRGVNYIHVCFAVRSYYFHLNLEFFLLLLRNECQCCSLLTFGIFCCSPLFVIGVESCASRVCVSVAHYL